MSNHRSSVPGGVSRERLSVAHIPLPLVFARLRGDGQVTDGVRYPCSCGWSTTTLAPTSEGALTQLIDAMTEHQKDH